VAVAAAHSREHNGFDLEGSLVPVEEIHLGGPARDGIPAIDRPKFVSGRDADFLEPDDGVLGLEIDGRYKAYPFAELSQTGRGELTDSFAGRQIRIRFDAVSQTAQAFDAEGDQLAGIVGFWFAWFAFHPQTEVFTAVP
jgi:hypothetical protein